MRVKLILGAMVLMETLSTPLISQQRIPTQPHYRTYTNVHVVDDELNAVANTTVGIRFQDEEEPIAYSTDDAGQIPWVAQDPGEDLQLILTDRMTDSGVLVGSIQTVVTPFYIVANATELLIEISRTQPLAKSVRVRVTEENGVSYTNIFPPNCGYPHWVIVLEEDSNLDFYTFVAPILDEEAVVHFLDYRGFEDNGQTYVRGSNLVFSDNVDLGADGIVFGTRLLGALPEGATVDVYNFVPHVSEAPGNSTTSQKQLLPLEMTLLETTNDVVYIHLRGTIQKGHMAILARSITGSGGECTVIEDNPPTLTVLGGNDKLKTCVPEVPDPPDNWECGCYPESNHCGTGTPASQKDCQVGLPQRSQIWCKQSGDGIEVTKGRTVEWKASFSLKGAQGTPMSSEGNFTYGVKSVTIVNETWTAQDGVHQKGQCMRFILHSLVCAQLFQMYTDRISLQPGLGGLPALKVDICEKPYFTKDVCTDFLTVTATCDMK